MTGKTHYADLEIRILERRDLGYPVEMTLNSEQEFTGGRLDPGFLPWVSSGSADEDGQRLFEWLLADDAIKTAWAQVRGQHAWRRIRLRIDAMDPELHALPWELLQDPGPGDGVPSQTLAAATSTPFSRYLAGRWRPGSPVLKRPIKILWAIASPENLAEYNLSDIDVDQEWALMQEATNGMDVEMTQLPQPCTLNALEAELKKGYHVFHFVGHGVFSSRHQRAALIMADESNHVAVIRERELAAMLARQLADPDTQHDDKLRLVFLASCQTATRSLSDAFRGIAPSLVVAGVPAVLAMQDVVPVKTCQDYARTFYKQLLDHGQVDLASNEARSAIITANLPGASIPVLFMRLRNGQLFGKRGTIARDRSETFWPFLLENIERGRCIPFLGSGMTEGLLPDPDSVARQLASKYGYPLAEQGDLVKVAQFIALRDPELLHDECVRIMRRSLFSYLGLKLTAEQRRHFRGLNFTQTSVKLNWAERVLSVQENEPHHLLTDFRLPLYITTNFDNFMVEALKYKGLSPRRVGPRWEQIQAGTPQYVLGQDLSPENPVVLYLNGHDDDPDQCRHLVLSEDDYLAHFVRMARDCHHVLPAEVITALTESSFLFIGYNLYDWQFRVILQGLVKAIDRPTKLNVGVQLNPDPGLDADKVISYFRRYLGRFDIEIYWGTPQQFVTELHHEWQRYTRGVSSDDENDEE